MATQDIQPLLVDERSRLAAVRRYEILDTPPDGAFDDIARVAAGVFHVPIAIISIVDHDRIWFKSHHGLEIDQVAREPGLCASAILEDLPTTIVDAKIDPRSMANSLVASDFGLRFYAAAPLRTSDGYNLGTLCVIDKAPRNFTDNDQSVLSSMAAVVVSQLELRLSARENARRLASINARMEDTIVERTAQLAQLSQELMRSSEEERAKLAGDLHDDMGSIMTLLMLKLDDIGRGLENARPGLIASQQEAVALVQELVASQRRLVNNLRPVVLDSFGLAVALRIHAEDWSNKTGIPVSTEIIETLPTLNAEAALALFRVGQESLTNVAKYGRATSVGVSLTVESSNIALAIEDNGVGINPDLLRAPTSHGLSGMRERLARFRGALLVTPGNGGVGTRVKGVVPLVDTLPS